LQENCVKNNGFVNWYCSLLTRRTVCGRAAGNTLRTRNQSERNETEIAQTQSWRYKTLVVIKCQQHTTITNKKQWISPRYSLVVSASASVLVGREFESLTKTL